MKKLLIALLMVLPLPAAAQNYLRDNGTFQSVVTGTSAGQLLGNQSSLLTGITLGSNLSLTGNTLNAAGTPPGGSSGQVQYNNAGVLGGFTVGADATLNTATGALTLATVNSNTGSFGSATQCVAFTTNGKGLITAASATTCTPGVASITGLGTGVATALAVNVGTAGAVVVNGGALGTPSSGVGTNLTGTASGLTAGTATNTSITDDNATNATMYPTWVSTASGAQAQETSSTKLTWNPSTGLLVSPKIQLTAGNGSISAPVNVNLGFAVTGTGQNVFSVGANSIVMNSSAIYSNPGGAISLGAASLEYSNVVADAFTLTNKFASVTAPTISSGFGGGSPTISAPNGTVAFRVTIGTASGSTGVLTMPAATTGWNCMAAHTANIGVSNFIVLQTASSTTSVTLTNYSDVAATATWVAGDIIAINCMAY